jgi:hypothetical protein
VQINVQDRSGFDQALGKSFGDYINPPIPSDDASPHECCEALWEILGPNITRTQPKIRHQHPSHQLMPKPDRTRIKPIGSLGEND